jgi:ABC-type multidrug transport system permease subunit
MNKNIAIIFLLFVSIFLGVMLVNSSFAQIAKPIVPDLAYCTPD